VDHSQEIRKWKPLSDLSAALFGILSFGCALQHALLKAVNASRIKVMTLFIYDVIEISFVGLL
jgi:hypothetical protein